MEYTKSTLKQWGDFIKCMVRGLSLGKTADFVRIHYTTTFYWRHKILDALDVMLNDTNLKGTVQMDKPLYLKVVKVIIRRILNLNFQMIE